MTDRTKKELSIHRKAWTARIIRIPSNAPAYKIIAQLETGKKVGLLERLQKDDPSWVHENVYIYMSRPMNKMFFKTGLGIKVVYL